MKKLICILLAVVAVAVTMTACGGNSQSFDRVDTGNVKHIKVAIEANEKPKYDIDKRKGVVELVDIYNSARFTETDGVKAKELLEKPLYTFTFYDYDGKEIASYSASPEGYVFKDGDLTKPYKLEGKFDVDKVKEVFRLYDVGSPPA